MNITVVGTGYVGLVTGTCFANAGNCVTCLDTDTKKVETLNRGQSPFFEPSLSELMTRSIEANRLKFTHDVQNAYVDADVIFICVGTPTGEDGRCDVSNIYQVAQDIANCVNEDENNEPLVVVKSTVPVGTTHSVASTLEGLCVVANNPEFLREGNAIEDFTRPDRVICGVEEQRAADILTQLYAPFVGQGRPIHFFDIRSSEMVKYASNAMLACKISFINEIASLCEQNGANIDHVRTGMCSDSRIGTQFFRPGLGYGGSCFPKDTLAVMEMGQTSGAPCLVNSAVHELNQRQRDWFANRILKHFDHDLTGKKIAMWGLAFKPQTDDVREAPSIDIAKTLLDAGAEVTGFDPEANETFKREVPKIHLAENMYQAIEDADALVICTEWADFCAPDFSKVQQMLKNPVIFDGRNMYSPAEMEKFGFQYYSVGRPTLEICQI